MRKNVFSKRRNPTLPALPICLAKPLLSHLEPPATSVYYQRSNNKTSTQVKLIFWIMQPQDMLAAWQLGEIDGGFVWQPSLSRMSDEGGNIVITCRELAKVGIITADLGIVRNEFVDQFLIFSTAMLKP
jgi:ABC-type taurine transport system substrate-binding protein